MSIRKLFNLIVSLTVLTTLVLGGARSASAMPANPTDPTKVPHYFGPYPNWANSPLTLPDAQVVITGNGTGAQAFATVGASGAVLAITVTDPGHGYTFARVDIVGSGSGATASPNIIRKGSVVSITLLGGGTGYTAPSVTISGNGTGAAATAYGGVEAVSLISGGLGYKFPTVDFDLPDGPGGVQAKGHALMDLNGAITEVIVDSPGSGYSTAPGVTIRDGTIFDPVPNGGSGAMVASSLTLTEINVDSFGSGYLRADVLISDPTGTGASATANLDNGVIASIDVTKPGAGYVSPGGIRKFVDTLPGLTPAGANNLGQYLPIAQPDTTTFPGTDYYVIGVVQHREKMHSDLAPTLLREYVQLSTNVVPGAQVALKNDMLDGTQVAISLPSGAAAKGVDDPHYLGPVIIAQKDRAVRITFYNLLPTGSDGDLFLPVDSSMMGSGEGQMMGMYDPAPTLGGDVMDAARNPMCTEYPKMEHCFKDNRATLHLHGGNTPWISDGTPHQWITPAGENTMWPEGVSVQSVPDMIGAGAPAGVPDCSAANDGCMTFYYTNQQSARLMFYHDHSWGITRLNVYAGEAAGYMITDPMEQSLLARQLIPADQIPLVIQDRTFVPSAAQLAQQDPTWDTARWGGAGSLWYHHVYMPAQNPGDPSGMSAFGRWMYGPWFWPPANDTKYGPIANPYYDPSCVLDDPATWTYQTDPFCEPELIPGTPNISAGMEQFNDTPLVNGTAYPTTTLQPKSYRLRILNAANDRFWNLQWYVADSTGTEVALKAAEVAAAQTDPNVYPTPDTALSPVGPSWIQIGTEGGFLPAPVIIPNQPITWITDATRFDFGNVNQHSLLLAPAERADVIVDFSRFAGRTLILYNDAPAAFPARVPGYDYYTGAPDLSPAGAPSTLPGYGPNTRTIMQVKIASTGAAPSFNLAALSAAFRHHADGSGVFESGQAPIIVGQAAYNSAYGTSFAASGWCSSPNSTGKCDGFARINQQGGDPFTFDTLRGGKLSIPLQPKAIHDEMNASTFDEYGRMQANLGIESVPATPGLTNVNLMPYVFPMTEIIDTTNLPRADVAVTPIATADDGTQIWKFTHNGVDTHPIHFHAFDVQVLNRVTWDNIIMPPDANELGWKDTVRVSPLQDTIVALRPVIPVLPFELPNSVRLLDPSRPDGDPIALASTLINLGIGIPPSNPNGQPIDVYNHYINFGAEYVYHCHILSHEEMDMMRPVLLALPPLAPSGLDVNLGTVTWNDNSITETAFVLEKSSDGGVTWSPAGQVDRLLSNANTKGGTVSFTDFGWVDGDIYRVLAQNTVGDSWNYADPNLNELVSGGFPTATARSRWVYVGDVTVPAAPSNLSATLAAGPQVDLTWTDNATDEAGFVVARSTDGVNFVPVASLGANITAFSDASVAPDATFIYRVFAFNAAGPSAYSNPASVDVIRPLAPTGLMAVQQGTQVALSWTDNASNESSYVVESSTDGVTFTALATLPANSNSYLDSSVVAGSSYSYRVFAANLAGASAYSDIATITVVLVPADPSGLTATVEALPQVSLSWTDNATDETGFVIERADNGGAFAQIATPAAFAGTGTVMYVDTSVALGNSYAYRVAAVGAAGQSGWSNIASADVKVPADPTNLVATLQAGPQISLSWTDNATNETGYFVERSTDGLNFSPLASLGADSNGYVDSPLSAGTTYSYRVYAANILGVSGFSNTASASVPAATAPAAPSNLSATNVTRTSLTVNWQDNSSNEDGFTIQVSGSSSFSNPLIFTVGPNVTSVDVTGLNRNTRYFVRAQAFNTIGASAWSATLSVRTAR